MNTTYRKNLKDVAIACKNYVDTMFNNFRWELGAYDIDLSTDSNVAYVKSVPSTAIGCEINTLGGMSYKSENLAILHNVSGSIVGIDYSASNGVISVSGTSSSTGNIDFEFDELSSDTYSILIQIVSGTQSTSSKPSIYVRNASNSYVDYSDNNRRTFSFTNSFKYIRVGWSETSLSLNLSFKIMVIKGSTLPTEFKESFTGIRDSAVSQLTIEGNLFDKTNVIARTYINSNGSLGTESQDGWYTTQPIEILNAVTFNFNTVQARWRLLDNSQNYISNTYNSTVNASETITNTVNAKYVQICFRMNDLDTFMVVNGSTAPSVFKPYIAPTTKSIPAQIQALDGYGWGVNSTCYNYIDFVNKKFVKKVGRVDLGSQNPSLISSNPNSAGGLYYINYDIVLLNVNNVVVNYKYTSNHNSGWASTTPILANVSVGGQVLLRYYSSKNTNAEIMAELNGVYLYYELDTPVETDISSYITDNDKYIDVEPSGTITFDNTYSQDVPSDIDYLIEEVKA